MSELEDLRKQLKEIQLQQKLLMRVENNEQQVAKLSEQWYEIHKKIEILRKKH